MQPSIRRTSMDRRLRLGYAVAWWDSVPERTWSYTPWSLLKAFQRRSDIDLTELELSIPTWLRTLLRMRYLRVHEGRLKSGWVHAPLTAKAYYSSLKRQLHGKRFDAVLSIGDWGDAVQPTFVYQDYSFLHLIHDHETKGGWSPGYDYHSETMLRARAERQRRSMQTLTGVFTMSEWDARHLRSTGLIDPSRVFVVGAGINVPIEPPKAYHERPPGHEYRVLFVGRMFTCKAGDTVVDAVQHLVRSGVRVRLVLAGPPDWPLPGPIPEWVTFLGEVPLERVRTEMAQADVYCMPSRYEGFGIVFSEALASGVPVIGRNDFAMPEFIRPGDNGYLLSADGDAVQLADLIHRVLVDPEMHLRVIDQARQAAAHASWDRVADDMVRIMSDVVLA